MRCLACDCELNDYESTRKDYRGEYTDLCAGCILSVRDTVRELDEPVFKEVCVNYEKDLEDSEEF